MRLDNFDLHQIMTKSVAFTAIEGYTDTVMGSIAVGELACVLASGPAPTTPADWRKALASHGHTGNSEAAYAHAIAAGLLIPNGEEMHLSSVAAKLFSKFNMLKATARA